MTNEQIIKLLFLILDLKEFEITTQAACIYVDPKKKLCPFTIDNDIEPWCNTNYTSLEEVYDHIVAVYLDELTQFTKDELRGSFFTQWIRNMSSSIDKIRAFLWGEDYEY